MTRKIQSKLIGIIELVVKTIVHMFKKLEEWLKISETWKTQNFQRWRLQYLRWKYTDEINSKSDTAEERNNDIE